MQAPAGRVSHLPLTLYRCLPCPFALYLSPATHLATTVDAVATSSQHGVKCSVRVAGAQEAAVQPGGPQPVDTMQKPTRVEAAAYIGKVRLASCTR